MNISLQSDRKASRNDLVKISSSCVLVSASRLDVQKWISRLAFGFGFGFGFSFLFDHVILDKKVPPARMKEERWQRAVAKAAVFPV